MKTLLALNAGSASLKVALFELVDGVPVERARRQLAPDDGEAAIDAYADGTLVAAGHRVVSSGVSRSAPARVTAERLADWRRHTPFAPLHQPRCLAPIAYLLRTRPALPQVACFDSAFHAGMPAVAQRYGVPAWLHEAGVRRWGYHGLSFEYVAGRLRALVPGRTRAIVAHLGSGASLCALHEGRSVATSMGFSTLGGVMMATRPGDLDPGLVPWLQREHGMTLPAIEAMLYGECGLKGVSGESGDLRTLLASDSAGARAAVEVYVYRIAREIGALAAALEGLDVLVFTGGVGANAAAIRAAVAARCRWLGVVLDEAANARASGEAAIADASAPVGAWVIPTDEEAVIARHALAVLHGGGG